MYNRPNLGRGNSREFRSVDKTTRGIIGSTESRLGGFYIKLAALHLSHWCADRIPQNPHPFFDIKHQYWIDSIPWWNLIS